MTRSVIARRALECVLLFGSLPLLMLWLIPATGWPWLLAFAGLACIAAVSLRGPCVRRCWSRRWNNAERAALRAIGVRWLAVCLLLLAAILVLAPQRFLDLPREHTMAWLLLLVSYPVFSVLPQETLYRWFFRLRYRPLFGRRWMMPSALAFGWAHIAFLNLLAPLFCIVGGLLFAHTYQTSRSLRLAVLEHSAYGAALFTFGYGEFFLSGPLTG